VDAGIDFAPGERLMTKETVADERPRCSANSFKLIEEVPAGRPFAA
jgi:hypothetical protein